VRMTYPTERVCQQPKMAGAWEKCVNQPDAPTRIIPSTDTGVLARGEYAVLPSEQALWMFLVLGGRSGEHIREIRTVDRDGLAWMKLDGIYTGLLPDVHWVSNIC
jgi:hypothetical protein